MWTTYMFDEKEIYDNEYKKALESKEALSSRQEDWVLCSEDEIKVGDIIYVEYSPDSQKYLYTHCPEYGTVKNIGTEEYYSPSDDKQKTEKSICILNHNGNLVNINKEHLSIYSRGYCYYIKKYVSSR